MNTIIVYFSQTGNTFELAKSICDGIRTISGQCDFAPLRGVDVSVLREYELIGLGCPTFAYAEPVHVSEFIEGLSGLEGKHAFVFSTHGGHPGNVLANMASGLSRQGVTVIGGYNCDGDDVMPHFTWPWFTAGHPDEVDLDGGVVFGKNLARTMLTILSGQSVALPKFQKIRPSARQGHLGTTQVNKRRSRGFEFRMTWDRRKCLHPQCNLCSDYCPVKAIDFSVSPVRFRKGCISCYFCELICPSGAIEVDPSSVDAAREPRIARLVSRKYPEFFEEAKHNLIHNRSTLFRMLVPHVEIGNATTFRDERHSKRPRYVVRQQPGGSPPAASKGNDPPRRQTIDAGTALPGISGTASDQED